MIIVNDEQRKLLIENVPNAEELFKLDDVNDLLTELDDVIIDKGMNKDYELTKLGLKLQKLYDEIYNQND